jgi:hypothetical protein
MPAELAEPAVRQALARGLAGGVDDNRDVIVWVKDGDEVVVWLDSLSVQLEPGVVRIRVDLETEQTGRAPQDVAIAVAPPSEPPSLLAVTSELPGGDARLAARWGQTLQDAVWGELLALADVLAGDHASGIAAADGTFVVHLPSDEPQ